MSWEGPVGSLTPSNVVVGNATTELAAANKNRRHLQVINRSDERVDIKFGEDAVSGEGVPVNAIDGTGNIQGTYEISEKHSNLFLGAINGICVSGGKTVTVVEGE